MGFVNNRSEEHSEMKCTKRSLIVLNTFFLLSGLAVLIFIILVETGVVEIPLPLPVTMALVIAVSALIVFPGVGLFTTLNLGWSFVLWCHSFFSLIAATVYGLTSIYSLIYLTGLDTDSALKNGWDGLFESLEKVLIHYVLKSPGRGLELQSFFGCCGISFKAVYLHTSFDMSLDEFLIAQATGPACGNVSELLDVYTSLPVYSESAQNMADAKLGTSFFCNDVVYGWFLENIILVSVVIVATLVLGFTSVCCSCLLQCSLEETSSNVALGPQNGAVEKKRSRGIDSERGSFDSSSQYGQPIYEGGDALAFSGFKPPPPPSRLSSRMQLLVKPKEYHAEPGFDSGRFDEEDDDLEEKSDDTYRPLPEKTKARRENKVSRSQSFKSMEGAGQGSSNQNEREHSDDTDSFFEDGETITSK